MLEPTFITTYFSFFSLADVVDQFAQLRNALGSVLGLLGLVRWLRDILTDRRAELRNVSASTAVPCKLSPQVRSNRHRRPRRATFSFIAFLGILYAMHKLVKIATSSPAPSTAVPRTTIASRSITTCVCVHRLSVPGVDAVGTQLQENEIVAVMGKLD